MVLAACAVAYLPACLLGYGTDIDVANVLRSGRSIVEDGSYEVSRNPGAVVHEAGVGLLDRLGGATLINVVGVAFALLALWAVHELVRGDGGRSPVLVMIVLAVNPWFWMAATSLGDFAWAMGFLLAGAVAAQRRHRWLAGLLFGLAVGSRASTILLVGVWLLAERTGRPDRRPPIRDTLRTAGVLALVVVACYIPPWLGADRTLDFLANDLELSGLAVQAGRWATKNAAVVGLPAALVLLVGARDLANGLGRWQESQVLRFGVGVVVASELLFFRLPLKPLHLLPTVVGVVLVAGVSPRVSRRWLAALAVAQLLGGAVGVTVAAPDVPDQAQSGHFEPGLTMGPLLNDVRCRLADLDRGSMPDPASDAAKRRAEENFRCQLESWRGR